MYKQYSYQEDLTNEKINNMISPQYDNLVLELCNTYIYD